MQEDLKDADLMNLRKMSKVRCGIRDGGLRTALLMKAQKAAQCCEPIERKSC